MEPRYLILLYSFPHRPAITYEDLFVNEGNAYRDAKYRKDEGYDVLLLNKEGKEIVIK